MLAEALFPENLKLCDFGSFFAALNCFVACADAVFYKNLSLNDWGGAVDWNGSTRKEASLGVRQACDCKLLALLL